MFSIDCPEAKKPGRAGELVVSRHAHRAEQFAAVSNPVEHHGVVGAEGGGRERGRESANGACDYASARALLPGGGEEDGGGDEIGAGHGEADGERQAHET